jgi:ArsR family transcriptional regulator
MTASLPIVCEPRLDLQSPDVARATETARLLADRTRATIMAMLAGGPHCVCEFVHATGERENNVSNHLAKLRAAGLVRATRHAADARFQYYERDEEACAAALARIGELLA